MARKSNDTLMSDPDQEDEAENAAQEIKSSLTKLLDSITNGEIDNAKGQVCLHAS